MNESNLSMKGRLRVDILNPDGSIAESRPWQPNLILDQGLNQLAISSFTQLFDYAVKGNDTVAMKESVTGSYTLVAGMTNTLTRVSGARNFVDPDDIGKLVRTTDTPGKECIIDTVASATVANIRPVDGINPLVAYSGKSIAIYQTQKIGMTTEAGRTNNYSSTAGENSTVSPTPTFTGSGATRRDTSANIRIFKRTFLFDPEPESKTVTAGADKASWAVNTVTMSMGSGTTFTSAMVGNYIKFNTSGHYAKITHFTNSTTITVDRTPPVAITDDNYTLYGTNSYSHIGFSHTDTVGDNLNILVRLQSSPTVAVPVTPLGANPEVGGQQVKVTYEMSVTFGPNVITSGNASISDPAPSVMGGLSKAGKYCIEELSSSVVLGDGSSDISHVCLEPAFGGMVALAPPSAVTVLKPVGTVDGTPDRSAGASMVDVTPDDYVAGDFTRTYTGVFGTNDGNGANWRVMGLWDDAARLFAWTYLFNSPQKKPASHQLTLRFRKTWNRDLS